MCHSHPAPTSTRSVGEREINFFSRFFNLFFHKVCFQPCLCRTAPSEILVSREFSREFFNFHFSFSISSHLSFTFNSRKRVKGIYFSLFTSRKKWKLSEFHSFFSRKKSEIRCGVWPDISLTSEKMRAGDRSLSSTLWLNSSFQTCLHPLCLNHCN